MPGFLVKNRTGSLANHINSALEGVNYAASVELWFRNGSHAAAINPWRRPAERLHRPPRYYSTPLNIALGCDRIFGNNDNETTRTEAARWTQRVLLFLTIAGSFRRARYQSLQLRNERPFATPPAPAFRFSRNTITTKGLG